MIHMVSFSFPSVVDLYISFYVKIGTFFATKGDFIYFRDTLSHSFAHNMRTTDNCEVIEPILETKTVLSHIKRRKNNKILSLDPPLPDTP